MRRSFCLSTVLLALLVAMPVWSHNGSLVVSPEVTRIVVDGDLADWPADVLWHPIERVVHGTELEGKTDLYAVFATVMDPSDTTLIVGIRVNDESVIFDSTGSWQSDWARLFLSWDHHEVQVLSSAQNDSSVQMSSHHTKDTRVYEWRIPLRSVAEAALSGSIPIGFDVEIRDVDEDDSASMLAWGPEHGSVKRLGAEHLQDLLLRRKPSSGKVTGVVEWADPDEGRPFGKLRITSIQYPDKPYEVFLNEADRFELYHLPEGSYEISIGYFGHWVIIDTVDVADNVHIELPPAVVARPPGGHVEEHVIESTSLSGNYVGEDPKRRIRVYLPEGYENSAKAYPVIYRLPGWAGRYDHSRELIDLAIGEGRLAPMIEVAVDGNTEYGGTIFMNSPAFGNWEDFLLDEVIPFVDSRYRTIQGPQGRALTGFSMGGWSAMILAVYRPGIWGAIGLNDPFLSAMWEMTHDKEDIPPPPPEYLEETLEAFRNVPSSLEELKSEHEELARILVMLGASLSFDANAPLWASYPRNKDGEWNPAVREKWDAYNLTRADVLSRHKGAMLQLGTIAIVIPAKDSAMGHGPVIQVWRDAGIKIETIDMPGNHGYQEEERFIILAERVLKALNLAP
ncbi:MAG: hypothetical protein GKR89_21390 [Candidatus Latescibacteria bacterium]|nr:hypothetical protein [Candidatus Latescibacterota bacterium]